LTTETAPAPRHIALFTLISLLALTGFRWVTLFHSPLNLHFDEAQYWSWAQHPAFGYVSKPPLIAWIIAASTYLLGDSEAGIRAAAPLLHMLAAWAIFRLARRLYSPLAGFWAAMAYITLPSVSYSSFIISTDVVLLPFWALALNDWHAFIERPRLGRALLLGLWLGLGLLAKYAMLYFILGMAVQYWLMPKDRLAMRSRQLIWTGLLAGLIILPNILWNIHHGWATFSHTADNADWQGPRKGGIGPFLEFVGGQVGMFGPIMLGLLIARLVKLKREPANERTIFLLSFGLPILLVVMAQSLIAGAHANWAAPAFASLCVLAAGWGVEWAGGWFIGSMGLHLLVLLLLSYCFANPQPLEFRGHNFDPFTKLRDWERTAALIDQQMRAHPGAQLLTDERKYAVLFNYYLRNAPYQVLIWPSEGKIHNQFSLTNSITPANGQDVVLASRWEEPALEHNFAKSERIGDISQRIGPGEPRRFYLFSCQTLQKLP
jgi:4-amino-4-deoxy-L-arabinose transferase-like glycosyltransferase